MSSSLRDNALDALMQPFEGGLLRWPQAGDALFLRAREGAALHAAGTRGLCNISLSAKGNWRVVLQSTNSSFFQRHA